MREKRFSAPVVLSLLLLFVNFLSSNSNRVSISDAPVLDDSDSVQFYVLESSFPYDAPEDIRDVAGSYFRDYGIAHAGLGVWDKTTDKKFTIEFLSNDYVGALLPDFDEDSKVLLWNNQGKVVFTTPSEQEDWIYSQMVSDTTGVAYNQLVTFIEDNLGEFSVFQPVEVAHYNASDIANDSNGGHTLVANKGSFWFVNLLVHELSTYGADTESFLDVHATSYQYISLLDIEPPIISWPASGPSNPEVYNWFESLVACYGVIYNSTDVTGGGAEYFFEIVKLCYGSYAYVYLTDTSVYNVTLGNFSSTYSTPNFQRYVFTVPDNEDDSKNGLQAIDYIIIAAVAVITLVSIVILVSTKMCRKVKRRRISMEGDKMATKIVDNIAGDHLHDEHELKLYYRGRPERWKRLWSYFFRNGAGVKNRSDSYDLDKAHFSNNALGAVDSLQYRNKFPNNGDSDDPSSDLVTPLSGTDPSVLAEDDSMRYLERLGVRGDTGNSELEGYVSPVLPSPSRSNGSNNSIGSSHNISSDNNNRLWDSKDSDTAHDADDVNDGVVQV